MRSASNLDVGTFGRGPVPGRPDGVRAHDRCLERIATQLGVLSEQGHREVHVAPLHRLLEAREQIVPVAGRQFGHVAIVPSQVAGPVLSRDATRCCAMTYERPPPITSTTSPGSTEAAR